eukprot:5369056-Prymnesium_polylepis.1
MFTLPERVAPSMNGSSSGHAFSSSLSRATPSGPTASHTFLRMPRSGSASMLSLIHISEPTRRS